MSWLFGGSVLDSAGPLSTPASQASASVKSISSKFDAYRTAAQKIEKESPDTITEDMKQKIVNFSIKIAEAENNLKDALSFIGAQAGGRRSRKGNRKSRRKHRSTKSRK